MDEAPGSLGALRRLNRLRVLDTLRRRGSVSRAEIARQTGLSRTTVSNLVGSLLEDGVVVEQVGEERQPASPNGGRPPTLLTLDPSAGAVVGIDFGHDEVRVAVADLAYTVLSEASCALDVDHRADDALSSACAMVEQVLDDAGLERRRVFGAGVALSAPVRAGTHAVASAAIFPDWIDKNVGEELGRRLRVPVYIGNDANLGALAEATFGAGRGVANLVYVMLATGVGAGLVLDGRLYEGDTGTAGELGHVVVAPDGLICRCGNRGCLETIAGARAIVQALHQSHGGDLTLADVLHLAEAGDAGARRVVADAGRAVGRALAGVCSLLDPRLVIVGGEVAAAGDLVLDGIRESIELTMTPSAGHAVSVVPGDLGVRAEVLGAIALAMSSGPSQLAATHLPSGAMP